jgi:hypothetical protein
VDLRLARRVFTARSTIGDLYVDGQRECFTLEDAVREGPKIPGQTAIPYGSYRIVIDYSFRFKRLLPLLVDVPGFTGIRIHPGNTDADTSGCILPGQTEHADSIGDSRAAFNPLFAKLQGALGRDEPVWIEITRKATQ